ncbi:fibrous sheath-interacting protein 1 isoform X2 [Anarrhichthys ocellatus]|uniref:fibrous sheath-interacting protein 1 isoform X2 n=1 Tax=Anarrhichthys ocellatus TaxID=433405 RepID=UPI0012EE60F9|nr:fibrous sheath-interacting protein 1 isoform X2 [Anarrhichthys ocellatus]
MEMIKGNLEDISRPASSEQTGSRVSSVSLSHSDRIGATTPFSLVVLTKDAADIQSQMSSEGATINSSARGPDRSQCSSEGTDEENEDSKLQRAIEEMRRLDEMLSAKICIEKEVRRQRKELQAKLWQQFLNKPEGHCECAHEAMNTRLFLALEAPAGTEEEDDFVPVFETQVLDCEHKRDGQYLEQSEKKPGSWTESSELSREDTGEEHFEGSQWGASKSKKKQKDFVKRNIELVIGEGDQALLTQAEKEHLSELLQGVDEEEEDSARGADSEEDMWAVSVLTGLGYTPELSDLEQLTDVDSKIRLLLPVEELLTVQSSYTNLSMCQGRGSEAGWKCYGDLQPGEKVLQDIKERRGQERRLQEIQQQLEILNQGQDMTNESPDLTEEQLLSLLDECELMESWTQDLETNDTTPSTP